MVPMTLMTRRATTLFAATLISATVLSGCGYVVIPEAKSTPPPPTAGAAWSGTATSVEETTDGLHVELAIRNDTGDWSAMEPAEGGAVSLVGSDGSRTPCTAVVETGGTSIPNGFITRGFTGGTRSEPQTELLRVDCEGATVAAGSRLSILYQYSIGEFNFYRPESPQADTMVVDLDTVVADLAFPIGAETDLVTSKVGEPIEAINKILLTLTEFVRTDDQIEFSWHTENPTNYQAYVHIGNPSVIGSDGILYGRFRKPHLVDTPITLANDSAEWTTSVTVPADVQDLYVLPAVESKQQKNYVSHAIDLSEE